MDRRSLVKTAGLAGILAAGIAPTVRAQASVRWRLASSFPKSIDTLMGGAEHMAKIVSDMTGGKFQISVHPGGELVPPLGVLDAVQSSTVEMCHTAPYYFFGKNEAFTLGCAIPFGMGSRAQTAWMTEGNGEKLMRDFYAGYNIVNFKGGNSGTQMGGWYRKELKSVEDLKGLKMRIGGFAGQILARLGAVPQQIAAGEIYQSLEKGTIDAAEWIGPHDDLKLGLYKVAPVYHYPGWWEGGAELDFFVSKKAHDALSAEYKAILAAACDSAHVQVQASYDAKNPSALKQLVANKVKVLPIPKSIMDAAFNASMEAYAELNAKNPVWKKIYADYLAFQKDQILWSRFSESSYDSYMRGAKLP